ncbi:MAG: hypothetical protein ACI304_05750 [Lepagella sp.]
MKKFLLSLAAIACAATMSAATYTVFDIAKPGTWTGDANGWTSTTTVGDKSFVLTTAKASSTTDLLSPVANTFAWRVYKGSTVNIKANGVSMKQLVLTLDDYNDGTYVGIPTLSEGWTASLEGDQLTLVSAGLDEITFTAEEKQIRIEMILASDEEGAVEPDPDPVPDGVVYQNAFDSSIDDWTKINDETLSDYSGWKVNSNPKCAIANSYYEQTNHAANAKMEKSFDLTNYENCRLSFEQAFGFDFPTAQVDNYRLYVKSGEYTDYLALANFPAAPASGNWTKEWAVNELDLSEYDGSVITIGFEYATDGSKSRAWELRNFVLYGEDAAGVNDIVADSNEAPVYYNLQGVRVNNPENGLFIVVKGNKSQKVVF